MQKRRVQCAAMVLVMLSVAHAGAGQDTGTAPVISYSPRVTTPGGSITIEGTRFTAGALAVLHLSDSTGQFVVLDAVPAVDGSFQRTVTIPAFVAPGRYMLFAADLQQQLSINLTGSLTVVAPGQPWFTTSPIAFAPGTSVHVSARSLSTTTAVFGLVSQSGQVALLGAAAVADGAFSSTFAVPLTLRPGVYQPFVRDAFAPRFALNTDGPLTIFAGSMPPAVPVGFYPIGAAVNPALDRLYVPNGGDDSLSILNGSTGAPIATVATGRLPCAIALNPRTNAVYVANLNSRDLTVIDGSTNAVTATVAVGEHPCAVAVTPALNRVFVGNYSANSLTVLDGGTNTVVSVLPTGGGPFGVAANPVTNRVYVVNGYDDSLTIFDAATLEKLAVVPVGHVPDAVGVNPATNRIYVANYFGNTVTVVDGDSHATIATVAVGRQPDAISVNWRTNRIFVSNFSSNTVTVIDGATNRAIATVPVGLTPDGLATNPLTGRTFVVNSVSNDVSILTEPASAPAPVR